MFAAPSHHLRHLESTGQRRENLAVSRRLAPFYNGLIKKRRLGLRQLEGKSASHSLTKRQKDLPQRRHTDLETFDAESLKPLFNTCLEAGLPHRLMVF